MNDNEEEIQGWVNYGNIYKWNKIGYYDRIAGNWYTYMYDIKLDSLMSLNASSVINLNAQINRYLNHLKIYD